MNVRLLRKIAEEIQKKPKQFDMDWYHAKRGTEGRLDSIGKGCGTTHCIAGWAEILADDDEQFKTPHEHAAEALGIDIEQANRLFLASLWPNGFGGYGATPKQAAARIEHFIKTGGRE